MKVHLLKDQFLPGLQTVQSIVSVRTTIPTLNNVLIKTLDKTIMLTTTDLDVGMRCEVEAKVDSPGSITLPAKRLLSIIREVPTQEFSIEVDSKNSATIRSGNFISRIMGISEEEFPPYPRLEGQVFKISQKELKEMVRKTSYCMSTDDSRYTLNGVLLAFRDQKLTIVATDGRRLALAETEAQFMENKNLDLIIPSKAVHEVERMLGDSNDVEILITENQISFTAGNTQMVSKLVDGKYPNYQQVIPNETKERATIERELLLNAVRRVSILSTDKLHSVKFHFSPSNLKITSTTPEVGEAQESIPIQYKGKEFVISFNPEYIMDPLKCLEGDTIHLDFTDDLSPAVFKHDKPFLYVIMPMRST